MRKTGREYSQDFRQAHKQQCPSCGRPMNYDSEHCRFCAQGGSNNPRWRGGARFKNSGGYMEVYAPDHPRVVYSRFPYVLEHYLIWEQAHGKPLPKGWIIHHLNGVKDDNRPQNLLALPDKKHRRILDAKARRIQELEALLNNQHQLL